MTTGNKIADLLIVAGLVIAIRSGIMGVNGILRTIIARTLIDGLNR